MTSCCCAEKYIRPCPRTTLTDAGNFELTLVSAYDLPVIRRWSGRPMKVYAEVSLDGVVQKTGLGMPGVTNPAWGFVARYPLTESTGGNLVVRLFCKRGVKDSLIGEVKLRVKSLFDMGFKSVDDLSYDVGGTLNGKLIISYSFGLHNSCCG